MRTKEVFREIYLDNAATARPCPEVLERIQEVAAEAYGNSYSAHCVGARAQRIGEESAAVIAGILGCQARELVFTSGGTESNNLAIKGYAMAHLSRKGGVVTTAIEHESVLRPVGQMGKMGFRTVEIPTGENGLPDLSRLEECMGDDTIMVSMGMVNSETGSLIDIKEASRLVKDVAPRCVFHVDAVQGFLKYPLNISNWIHVDLLTVSGHKIGGPKGIGALFVRKNIEIEPLLSGGGRENSIRAGTENTPLIAGFALASQLANARRKTSFGHAVTLRERLIQGITQDLDSVRVLSPEPSSPYIVNIAFKNIEGEILMNHLSSKGICVSTGSACSSRKQRDSHILRAMGVPGEYRKGALRFSFSHVNTIEEIDTAIREICSMVRMLQKLRRV